MQVCLKVQSFCKTNTTETKHCLFQSTNRCKDVFDGNALRLFWSRRMSDARARWSPGSKVVARNSRWQLSSFQVASQS